MYVCMYIFIYIYIYIEVLQEFVPGFFERLYSRLLSGFSLGVWGPSSSITDGFLKVRVRLRRGSVVVPFWDYLIGF